MAKASNFIDLADSRLASFENAARLIGQLGGSSYQADRTIARQDWLEAQMRAALESAIKALKSNGRRPVSRQSIANIR